RDRQARSPRQRGPVAARDHRADERHRRGLRRGMEVRPRHHGAAQFPHAAVRPPGDSGERELPGPAADAAAPCVRVRPRAAPRVRGGGQPERVALVGTGGISHWPATPDSGVINEAWDREFLERFIANRREELISYTDEQTLRDAGQGGFEIRTFLAVAGATEG